MYMFVLLFDALEIPLWSEMEKAADGVRLLAGCSHFLLWCWWCAAVVVVAKNSVVGFLGEKCNFLRKKLVHPSGKGLGGLGERFCWKIFCADFSNIFHFWLLHGQKDLQTLPSLQTHAFPSSPFAFPPVGKHRFDYFYAKKQFKIS